MQEGDTATLTRPLAHGEGESWVRSAGRGKIHRQVVAASLKACVAMNMPARDFFDDIRRAPDVTLEPHPTTVQGSQSHKFEGIPDWWETEDLVLYFPLPCKAAEMVRTRHLQIANR